MNWRFLNRGEIMACVQDVVNVGCGYTGRREKLILRKLYRRLIRLHRHAVMCEDKPTQVLSIPFVF